MTVGDLIIHCSNIDTVNPYNIIIRNVNNTYGFNYYYSYSDYVVNGFNYNNCKVQFFKVKDNEIDIII